MKVPGLLYDGFARVEHARLPFHLEAHRAFDRPERVHVLGLGTRSPRSSGWSERDVDVTAQAALLHSRIRRAERTDEVPQFRDVGPRDRADVHTGAGDRLGHDLHQWDPGAVVVDE